MKGFLTLKHVIKITVCAVFMIANQLLAWQENFTEMPEVLATAFEQDITKQQMLEYYSNNVDLLPEWLPEPYNYNQATNLAINFIRMKQVEIGATINGFEPSANSAEKYLRNEIANLSVEQKAKLDNYLAYRNIDVDAYVNEFKNSESVQRKAANAEFLDSLIKLHHVSEQEKREYYQNNLNKFLHSDKSNICYIHIRLADTTFTIPGQPSGKERADKLYSRLKKGEDFYVLAGVNSLDKVTYGEPKVEPRVMLNKTLLAQYESLDIDEISKPFKMGNSWYIIQRKKFQPKSFEEAKTEVEYMLESQRHVNIEVALDVISKLKMNFETQDSLSVF